MDTLRPEYVEAVAAARWNLWLIPLFLAAPAILVLPIYRRWHWGVILCLAFVAALATWVSLFGYSETIWRTMEVHAESSAEIEDVTSDTGRVFGPFFLGIPFALFYTTVWWAVSFAIAVLLPKLLRSLS